MVTRYATLSGMPFEKGHPPYPPKEGNAFVGLSKVQRERRRKFSEVISDGWPVEEQFHWLNELRQGRDPDSQDGRGTVDLQTRRWAGKALLDRMHGLPAQHVVMEAEMKALTAQVGVPTGGVAALSSEQLAQVRAALALLQGAGKPVLDTVGKTMPRGVPVVPVGVVSEPVEE